MACVLPIVKLPDPLLRQRARVVELAALTEPWLQELIDDMIATMWHVNGIGIAAPQVGHGLRLAIVTRESKAIPLINPVISRRSLHRDTMEEGCLSVPGAYGPVRRATTVRCRAYDRRGEVQHLPADELLAKIIQHEVDHLNGILFVDRARSVTRLVTQPTP